MAARQGKAAAAGRIHIGIGGWTFEPWRGVFYPKGLPHKQELEYASGKLTSIEINGTFYRTQTPSTFRGWRDGVPDGFVFAVKAPRYATHRRVLAEAGDSVTRFLDSGLIEMGAKLGPILWQLMPTAKFDKDDMARFLDLLPAEHRGQRLRHAVEVRHESFASADFVRLLRDRNIAVVAVESGKHTPINDVTADFVYARLENSVAAQKTGYAPAALDAWAKRLREWAAGNAPRDLDCIEKAPEAKARDVFAYFISGAKERNPAAAMAMIERLDKG
jgi:uncharacterized protein YecE (DUF72 family)